MGILSNGLKSTTVLIILSALLYSYIGTDFWNSANPDSENFVFNMSSRLSVFVVGGTGEVGKEVVKELAKNANILKVTLIGRRKIDLPSDEGYTKFKQEVVDFDKLSDYAKAFEGHDAGICTLGTTRAKSGADGFYKVDHDYVLETGKQAKDAGCKHFSLVTTAGANKNSFFLYPRTKGQVEEDLSKLEFERFSIFHPTVLLCNRNESRIVEKGVVGILGVMDRWRVFSIETSVVGRAIVHNLFKETTEKMEIIENSNIKTLGKL